MIYDRTAHLAHYAVLSPAFAVATAWLRNTDLAALPPDGKRVPVDGERVFAIPQRYDTFTAGQEILESHRRYHDIQVLLDGEEGMRVLPDDAGVAVIQPYEAERDAQFYDAGEADATRPGVDLTLTPGVFAILTPADVHGPNRTLGDTPRRNTKVVVKVAVGTDGF